MLKTVYFAHGKDSIPWGRKIVRLAEIARAKGWQVVSPDYTSTRNPDERVEILRTLNPGAEPDGRLVLVGSSMGAYVSAVVSETAKPDGLFLMAPAFFRPNYKQQSPRPYARHTLVIHAWEDEIVPVDNSIRYAREHRVPLTLVNSDHGLFSALPAIERLFSAFLDDAET